MVSFATGSTLRPLKTCRVEELIYVEYVECQSFSEDMVGEFVHTQIVEVEIGGVAIYRPFGEFRRAKSYCHVYGAQGQRQAYF
ncbi:hypothetical protein TNCV_2248341 [Trichonephila clavipes]|nr:hypothetical protein TNCV_2248341 [Trichonephila clavipes]